ncbi:outer membrane protein, OmpA family protein [Legionella beliardensis]|uniref:Outer membrane protein, OmpA family protein n=1 Tax=Legionella beliardensis TaxID=91822 RepID=A0A378I3Z2_9GAMM|nr:C-OmpA-like family protein CmpA [Legionella beliardensis]STX29898.1 outer membrane protein, OmpA family protein [Legionella beliardensis]
MLRRLFSRQLASISLIALLLGGCSKYQPPYNNFQPYNRTFKDFAIGASAGTVVGAVVGGTLSTTLAGTAIGAVTVVSHGLYKDGKLNTLRELQKADVQYVEYGDTTTLIVPTDRYFRFNSARINELCYPGLMLIAKVIKMACPIGPVYVAGFTDNVGSRQHKNKLTQARAEAMLTFLWANKIHARRLSAEGYGDKYDVSDNQLVHGSAQNRRLEIQCARTPLVVAAPPAYIGMTK